MKSSTRFFPAFFLVWAFAAGADEQPRCDQAFADIFDKVAPSVVQVYAVSIDPFSVMHRVRHGVGTGFVIDDEGHIVTNAHVVHGTTEVMVSLGDDDFIPAKIVGIDPISDLAVIELVIGTRTMEKLPLGSMSGLRIGDEVLAVGFPFGIGKSATRGIVSGVDRVMPFSTWSWMMPFLQTDAAISPGNSGGPLVDRCGRVIAVNTLASLEGQNVNLSIPIDSVQELIPQLIEHGRVIRPWHGINGAIIPMPLVYTLGLVPGYMVETIEPGSPAEEIGLRGGNFPVVIAGNEFLLGGDIIVEVNGTTISNMDAVYQIARSMKVGDEIKIRYFRDGSYHKVTVVLPERPILPGDTRRFYGNRH